MGTYLDGDIPGWGHTWMGTHREGVTSGWGHIEMETNLDGDTPGWGHIGMGDTLRWGTQRDDPPPLPPSPRSAEELLRTAKHTFRIATASWRRNECRVHARIRIITHAR